MLVGHDRPGGRLKVWRWSGWISMFVLLGCLLSLAPYLGSSTELVRLRNALMLRERTSPDFEWAPPNVPASFFQERGPVDPFFIQVVQQLRLAELSDDWARAVAISRHLLSSSPVLKGGAVKSNLRGTYQSVIAQGDGYCGDFTEVFVAIAIAMAAGIPVRTWTFSFDAFGGHGHVWPEIWNRQISRWQLINVFNSYYFVDTAAMPLSALTFRKALLSGSSELRFASLDPRARPGWYMGWGNNVFTYDQSRSAKLFSDVSSSLEQLGAIAEGVYPSIRLLADDENQAQVQAMWRLHLQLIFLAWLVPVAALVFLVCLLGWAYRRHRSPSAYSFQGLEHGSH